MATAIVLVGVLLRLQRQRRPRGRGPGDGQVDGAQPGARERDRHVRHTGLLGRQPASPDRGLSDGRRGPAAGSPPSDARRGEARARARQPAPTAGVTLEPSSARASRSDEFQYHTGTIRPSKAPDAIEFVDVHKSFGRNHVLRGLNMGLPEGKISMIIGPSGTGKSVCIKHIVGLLYPDEGDVIVHGQSIPSLSDARSVRAAQEVRRAVPGRRAVRLAEPVRQRRLPAAPAHREGRGRDRRDRQPPPARGRPGGRGREDAQRALRRDAQARRASRARSCSTRKSCCSTSPTRASTRCARRCCAS